MSVLNYIAMKHRASRDHAGDDDGQGCGLRGVDQEEVPPNNLLNLSLFGDLVLHVVAFRGEKYQCWKHCS